MGYPGRTDHPEVRRKIEEGISLALGNNVAVHMHLFEAAPNKIRESAKNWLGLGARILTCMTDRRVLSVGMKETFSSLTSIRGSG